MPREGGINIPNHNRSKVQLNTFKDAFVSLLIQKLMLMTNWQIKDEREKDKDFLNEIENANYAKQITCSIRDRVEATTLHIANHRSLYTDLFSKEFIDLIVKKLLKFHGRDPTEKEMKFVLENERYTLFIKSIHFNMLNAVNNPQYTSITKFIAYGPPASILYNIVVNVDFATQL